jgi:sigma-B regulation protein RsbU (phosphoserine phosphatase)
MSSIFPTLQIRIRKLLAAFPGTAFPPALGFAGLAVTTGKSLKIDDVQNDDVQNDRRHYLGTDKTTGLATRNLIAMPLNSLQSPVGVIEVVNRRGGPAFSDEDLHLLEALSGSIAIALDNARLYAEARQAEARLRTSGRCIAARSR